MLLKRTRVFTLTAAVLAVVLIATAAQAASIGLNFGSNRSGASLAAGDLAGVVAQMNWNNAPNADGSITNAMDDSGAGTTLGAVWSTDESWSHSSGATTADGILMEGWVSANNNSTASNISLSDIPYAGYDLYLYVSHDRANDDTRFNAPGTSITDFVTLEDADDATVAANPFVFNEITTSGGTGNYFKASGLTGSSLSLDFFPNNATSDRGPLSALQIVEAAPPVREIVPIVGITGHQQGDSLNGNGSMLTAINLAGITVVDPVDPSTWTHANSWQTDWQGSFPGGSPQDAVGGWAVLDLGSPQAALENLYLWNVNEGSWPSRGTNEFNLYYATSPDVTPPAVGGSFQAYDFSSGGWTQLGDTLTLAEGTGSAGLPVSGIFDISGASGAQYIGIDILSGHGSDWRVGLSEIVVTSATAVPEPSTFLLLASGLLGLAWYGRRRRK